MPSVGGYTSNMFLFLLSLVVLAKVTYQAQTLTKKDIIDEINKFRTAVATGKSANNKNTFLPQSDQMFRLEANEDLAKIAMLLTMMCDDSTVQAPYSSVYYRSRKAVDKTVVDNALTYWYETAEQYMDQKATYKANLKDFAEVVYYKSTRVGCVVAPFNCTTGKLYGFACVFNNRPQIGEALYPVTINPTLGTGCSANSCPAVDGRASKCISELCEAPQDSTFPPNVAPTTAPTTVSTTASTTASTAAATSTTSSSTTSATKTPPTTTAAAGVITKDIQDMIVLMHNNRRMMAAKGTVINGKSGTYLPQGSNLNELRYDTVLGLQAQQAAENCPTNTAATINNYAFGENVLIAPTVSSPYKDLIESAIRIWFDEIYVNGMNRKMNFTDFLANKPNPPTHFTQIVWANHLAVGCGAHRCGSNTVIVCRYRPGGNIIGQFVYKVGTPCSACQYGCSAQSLCIVPLRN